MWNVSLILYNIDYRKQNQRICVVQKKKYHHKVRSNDERQISTKKNLRKFEAHTQTGRRE